MARTLRVRMRSRKVWPGQPVTYKWDQDDWATDHPCTYDDAADLWSFDVDIEAHPLRLEFKFRFEGRWQLPDDGGNLAGTPREFAGDPGELASTDIWEIDFPR